MTDEPTCATCNAWLPDKRANPPRGQERMGYCRAKPPVLLVGTTMLGSALDPKGPQSVQTHSGSFPPASADMWCRKHQPKEVENDRRRDG